MSRTSRKAGVFAFVVLAIASVVGAQSSGAFAQDQTLEQVDEAVVPGRLPEGRVADTTSNIRFVSREVVQPLPEEAVIVESLDGANDRAASLDELVATLPVDGEMSKDMRCLAGAIYFESRGEPLLGQLAVGRVIVNRAESDSFPSSYCGVVYQRSQFSFVRGGRMPAINQSSDAWHRAKAIAKIAHEGLWESPAKGALYFHASYVQPRWRLTRVARVDTHIFYR